MKKLSAILFGLLMLISTSSFADADVRIGQVVNCGEGSTCGECVDQTGRGQEDPNNPVYEDAILREARQREAADK